ncbi:MAG: hypothetical protein L3J24_06970 [Xanthomonadales bacterium]|nr:hypothetical protein [Xanthomonadales bacterium]
MDANNNSIKPRSKLSRRGFVQATVFGVSGMVTAAHTQTIDQGVKVKITSSSIDKCLEELGITLPELPSSVSGLRLVTASQGSIVFPLLDSV